MKHSIKDWILATRPWSFPASTMPVLTALLFCWSKGLEVNWLLGILAIFNIVLVHAAGNVWSDIFDFKKGVDAADTFGVRLLVDGVFTTQEFKRLSLTLNVLAVMMGLGMVSLTGLPLLYIGVFGILLSFCYPSLKYIALGDVVIILCYSLLPMLGTSFIVSGQIYWPVLWLSVPVGLITVAILHVNNYRDVETDRRAGISTIPLITGRSIGRWMFTFETLFPYVWLLAIVLCGIVSWWLLVAFVSLPLSLANVKTLWNKDLSLCANLDEKTAQLQLAFSMALSIGFILSVLL